ncbi:MAG: hypothetical protein KatS3mg057_2282 [Herpetosiphonaceae bacterium]|nr:MAG: hypothetical protein KatS3mg057_2282 [Herpetosiphonaceae bacterium]
MEREHGVHRASELRGKRIIDQSTGAEVGSVKDLVLDQNGRRAIAFLVDTGGLFGEQRAIRWQSVVSVGDVVVVQGPITPTPVKEDSELDELLRLNRRITGTKIISEVTGEQIGSVSDVTLDDRGQVLGFETAGGFLGRGSQFLSAEYVRTVGKDAIIVTISGFDAGDARERERGAGEHDTEQFGQ